MARSEEHLYLVQLRPLAVVMVGVLLVLLDPEVRGVPEVAVAWGEQIIWAVQPLHRVKVMLVETENPILIMGLVAAEGALALLVVLMYLE